MLAKHHPTATAMPDSSRPFPAASETEKDPRLKKKGVIFGLGIVEILMGIFSGVLTIIALSMTKSEQWRYSLHASYRVRNPFPYSSPGIWGGIFVIVAGSLGVRIKSDPSRCMYIGNLIMAIITACVTFSAAFVSGFSTGLSYYSPVLVVIHVTITLLNLESMIITIIHAAFCGGVLCCNRKSRVTQPVVYVPAQSSASYPQRPQYIHGSDGPVTMSNLQQISVQGYSQSSGLAQVFNHRHLDNNFTEQKAQPPSYDHLNG